MGMYETSLFGYRRLGLGGGLAGGGQLQHDTHYTRYAAWIDLVGHTITVCSTRRMGCLAMSMSMSMSMCSTNNLGRAYSSNASCM